MENLTALLERDAANLDEEPLHAWEVRGNGQTWRVKAATKASFATSEAAFEGARQLRSAIVGLGFREQYLVEVGTTSDGFQDVPATWRGVVNLGLERA